MKNAYLIIGGAGFIGINLADYYLAHDRRVTIFDNFSRKGTEDNVLWLKQKYGDRVDVVRGDIRKKDKKLNALIEKADVVFHQAAQVAVTTSVYNPEEDFEVNALGTFNVLEAVRMSTSKPILVYSSTNKVYGKMTGTEIKENKGRYMYSHLSHGVPETQPLDFYSPYGCSKGTGDQYMIDYSRIYGLKTIVFRQSCIYGPHQFGVEDQGWVAWFAIRAMQNRPVTIYGDGKQIRDVLYIEELMDAYNAAIDNIERTVGKAFNIGGGVRNTLSLLELIKMLEERFNRPLEYSFDDWRPGDQLVYVSDVRKAGEIFAWEPRITPETGLSKLLDWISENKHLFSKIEK